MTDPQVTSDGRKHVARAVHAGHEITVVVAFSPTRQRYQVHLGVAKGDGPDRMDTSFDVGFHEYDSVDAAVRFGVDYAHTEIDAGRIDWSSNKQPHR
ncbi:hypothetical protein [Piscinibacter koreensis]|uniref:Uncharacterized protein n=1 Tax=Piscinibacter koreensis TaxID=2742824 RepID=A0A7Y6TX39_9BURK|nr:hypothetical protein [Schlegelella koreensis]NUZ06692.1 hypothetical protein [Schlegelella koreensis]